MAAAIAGNVVETAELAEKPVPYVYFSFFKEPAFMAGKWVK